MRVISWSLAAVATLAVAAGSYWYWEHVQRYPSTDDAYVGAHVVRIAAQVEGRVTGVHVRDQQQVERGTPLFDIDPQPFELAVQRARAHLAVVRQTVAAESAAIRAAAAEVNDRQVLLDNARESAGRIRHLVARHFASQQAVDDANAAVNSARAQLALAQASLHEARVTLGTGGQGNQQLREAQVELAQNEVNLSYTHPAAPCDGQIAQLSLRPGDVVSPAVPLFALICNHEWWVDANFKETRLERIHAGQPATVDVDMYPGHPFHGRVEQVGGASGV
ncbi:MAG: HlyD family secretion protein, partial [Gammaproteobacteria bacterium]